MNALDRFFAQHTILCLVIGSLFCGPILLILIGSVGYESGFDHGPGPVAPDAPQPVIVPAPITQPQPRPINAQDFIPTYKVPEDFGIPIDQDRHDTVIFIEPAATDQSQVD